MLLGFSAGFAQTAPAAPVQAFGRALLDVMRAGKATPFAQRAAKLRPVVAATFDLEQILRSSVGVTRWNAMAPTMRADLLTAFTDFTVATWVANFDSYEGEKFEVAPETRNVETDVVVSTRIVPTQGDATRLDYVMRSGNAGWRAIDILLDGSISRVAVQRSDFRGTLSKGEGALLDLLRGKAADLAIGAK